MTWSQDEGVLRAPVTSRWGSGIKGPFGSRIGGLLCGEKDALCEARWL